jgi:hypothetical protein
MIGASLAPAAADETAAEVAAGTVDRHAAKRERPLVLEEEVALLRKEEAEPCEVDLLFIGLDLREVGVDREVGNEPLRDAIFQVETGFGFRVVQHAGRRQLVRRHAGDRIRLDIHVGPRPGSLEADE